MGIGRDVFGSHHLRDGHPDRPELTDQGFELAPTELGTEQLVEVVVMRRRAASVAKRSSSRQLRRPSALQNVIHWSSSSIDNTIHA